MHHYNTILSQMLKMFSRYEFQKAVFETKAEYHARGFSSWNHFVAMLFGQLSGQDSLRGIEAGLATQGENLYHAGIKPIHRSRVPGTHHFKGSGDTSLNYCFSALVFVSLVPFRFHPQ